MPEPAATAHDPAGARLAVCATDIVELASFRVRDAQLNSIAAARGLQLPSLGRSTRTALHLSICVRPERWLVLCAPAAAGGSAALWQEALAGVGAAIDHSSGLTALHLAGPAVREVLARGCRLDLAPQVFAAGQAAATIIAQVPTILLALISGVLLLTPSTTAQHFSAWFAGSARAFGFIEAPVLSFAELCADAVP